MRPIKNVTLLENKGPSRMLLNLSYRLGSVVFLKMRLLARDATVFLSTQKTLSLMCVYLHATSPRSFTVFGKMTTILSVAAEQQL